MMKFEINTSAKQRIIVISPHEIDSISIESIKRWQTLTDPNDTKFRYFIINYHFICYLWLDLIFKWFKADLTYLWYQNIFTLSCMNLLVLQSLQNWAKIMNIFYFLIVNDIFIDICIYCIMNSTVFIWMIYNSYN